MSNEYGSRRLSFDKLRTGSLRVVVGLARHPKPTKVGHNKLRTIEENLR